MKKTILITLFLISGIALQASDTQVVIAQANKAYTGEYFANAAELYKKVIQTGYESPELYYNLGNTYYKLNELASAILYYEKARKMDPGNDDINFNLSVANSKIADKIEPLPELFYKRWFRTLRESFAVDEWGRISVATLILALISGFIYFISNRMIFRKAGFWFSIVFFVTMLFSLFFAYQNYRILNNNKEAIIFSPTITIKSSPDEKSVDLFVLHEGTKVRLIDNIGNWYEIRIANGSVGWIEASAIQKI
jgi:tetratricopeptide (TPR) repeat protein